jgi:hypothetical protein
MGLILTAVFSLFSRYEPGAPHHFLYNGLPLPTFTQVIDPVAGSLVSIEPNMLGIFVDVLFFSAVWLALKRTLAKLRRGQTEE